MPMAVGHSGATHTICLGKLVEHLRETISDLAEPRIVLLQSYFTGKRQCALRRRDRSPGVTKRSKGEASAVNVLEQGRNAVGTIVLPATRDRAGSSGGRIIGFIRPDYDIESRLLLLKHYYLPSQIFDLDVDIGPLSLQFVCNKNHTQPLL